MKKNVTKRLTSLFLASVMAASMAPTTTLNALAKENESIVTMDEANSQTSALPGQSEVPTLQATNAEESHSVKLQVAPANTTIKLFDSENKEVTLSEPTIASNINTYDVSLKEGTYTYEGFNKNGQSIGGASITVDEKSEGKTYQFKELKFKATNSGWTVGNEYNVKVGMSSKTNYMNLSTAANDGYAHGLGLCGETFFYELAPNATLSDEGYLSFTSSVTVTYSSAAQSISGKIPQGYDYKITAPEDITVFVGQKINHYQYFTEILPVSKSTSDGTTTYIFKLADATQYNYRLSKKGALTYCDYFKMSNTLEPLNVTEDMLSGDPKTIDRDLTHNNNSNVADVFLNINEKNYLSLDKVGDTFQIVNLRNWEAIDGWANNYFMEPDYHYEVIDENGDASTNVVKVDENGLITAVGNGTAIVKVTYDAFKCFEDLYGAIWPENTGVFVVTVGAEKADIDTGMKIHENNANNQNTTMKLAGVNVDAELDVFYYLKGEEGAKYSFTPSEGTTVELLNPTLTDTALSYNGGFSTKGVTNDNGTYTLNLTKGRNIVKLTKDGKSTYQVLSAKEVSYTIENETHPGERPKGGDTLRINFDTYYIPCNKLAGVYNMSGTVKYTSSNEKASVKSKGNQYTFASKYSYVEVALAEDIEDGTITLSNGYILESGFGSPYGDHRGISYTVGKNPNFTAGVRTAFFGQLPDVSFEVGEESHAVKLKVTPANTTIKVFDKNNKEVTLSESSETSSNINIYEVSLKEGTYTYEGFNKDGKSIGGATFSVDESSEGRTYQFKELKFKAKNTGWTLGNEYSVKVGMTSKTNYMNVSDAPNDGYAHVLGLCGEAFFYELVPNKTLADKGYLTLLSSKIVVYSASAQTISDNIPIGYEYKITAPEDITVYMGQKFNNYQYFNEIEPVSKSTSEGKTTYNFKLADAAQYNYRLSKAGAVTYCNNFKMSSTLEDLSVTEDMLSGDPKTLDRDLTHQNNSNIADVFLNINEKNYLCLNKAGDTFQIVNLRNWEAIDTISNNYFMEPDYHYEVIDENGDVSTNVVKVDENGLITAVGNGTAIVKVTYDAFRCHDDFYGAIWPENTGVFVVTVGEEKADIDTGMKIHEDNTANQSTTKKLSTVYVDAELDVFYYLKGQEGAKYTFTPSEGTTVELLNPTLTDTALNYNGGFSTKGVTNDNGTYTVNLTQGKNIVKLTKDGKSTYQVLTAKEVSYTIENETHPGERPAGGDTIKINFDTYYMPANKLAGIYNMSGIVKYTSSSEKASVTSKGNQYNFASKYSYVEVALAEDIKDETITLSDGYIQEYGFGVPFGDHRAITYTVGKNPNSAYLNVNANFGQLPDVSFEVDVPKSYDVTLNPNVEGALITVKNSEGSVIEPKEGITNTYTLPYGSYSYKATKEGYEDLEGSFEVDKENQARTIDINLVKLPDLIWDGQTATPVTPSDIKVPVTIDGTSYEVDYKLYNVSYPSQLYWIATKVNEGTFPSNAKIVLDADLDMGNQPWTTIGSGYNITFSGIFDGQGHTIKNLSLTKDNYAEGLFGYVRGTKTTIKIDDKDVEKLLPTTISNLTVEGKGTHTSGYSMAGIVGCLPEENSDIYLENLVNKVDLTSAEANTAGILGGTSNTNVYIRNCKNYGNIESTAKNAYTAGIVGESKCVKEIKNCFNYGNITGGSILAGIISHTNFSCDSTNVDVLIENCGNYGNITTTNYTAGGIIGNGMFFERKATQLGIKIKNCFNKGDITCTSSSNAKCGGIMGEGMPHIDSCYNTGAIKGAKEVGGLVGKFYGNFDGVIGKITNSYNSGKVTATSGSYVGSVVGRFDGDPIVKNAQTNMDIVKGLISNSYVLKGCASRVSGNNYSYVSATVLSSDELKASANSISASFTKGSIIYDNIYPILTIEKYSDNEEAALVDEAIAKLGDEINLDSDVLAVKEAYDNLSDEAKALVKNLASLEEKLAKYNSLKAVQNVTTLIDAIGEVSLESKDAIDKAQTAYDALTEDEKALVTNEAKLSKAKEDYKELLVKEAKEVDALIEKIGDVSLKSEKKINAAKEAYEKLSDEAKEFVEKLDILKEAEEEFAKLTKEKELNEAAKEIIKLISAIDYTDETSVTAARKAYDAASSEVKELVVNYNTLLNAESYLAKKAKEDEEAAAKEKEALEAAKKEKELNEAAKVIINLISAIDYTNADSVTAARKAYDAASSEVKALVINYNTLVNAESYLAKKAKEDEEAAAKEKEAQEAAAKEKELNEAAKVIINLISAIDYTNADSVTAARKAYDAASSEVKALVVNYNSLLNAESYLAKKAKEDEEAAAKEKELQEAAKKEAERITGLKEEAKKVDDLILAIGTVTTKSEKAINEAFDAYNALNDEAKTYVTQYTALNVAKLKYNVLVSGNVDGIAITLNKQSATLYTTTQKTITLKATVKGTDEKVTWKSSNPKVATVSSEGVVVAKSAGKVTITASVGAYKKTATITVKKVTVKPSKTTIKLKVGKTAKITVTSNFKGSFKWASKNKAIATVTTNGVIKARKVGTVKITVTIAGVQKVITVKVVK